MLPCPGHVLAEIHIVPELRSDFRLMGVETGFLLSLFWEFAISHWDDSKQSPGPRLLGLKRGRGKENFFPNLGIGFSILVWHHLLVTYTTQEVKLIPLAIKTLKMLKNFLWNQLSWEWGIGIAGVAVDCVGTFCRKLSDFFV